ncbi:MAG TPA: transglutaminase family protein [Pirellulales bacterium]|jgi:transglutaminase-like putative cysteine protease|nr:transglutaminase family protein [Pirellulales bacterium]
MRYQVIHTTTYEYSETVPLCHNQVRLTPRGFGRQQVLRHSLTVAPRPSMRREWTDLFGNTVTYFSLEQFHNRLTVTSQGALEVAPWTPPNLTQTPAWEIARDDVRAARTAETLFAAPFVFESPFVPYWPEAAEYARPSFPAGRPLAAAVMDLTERIHAEFVFDPRATTINTPVGEVLTYRRGVCQDFAHLQISCLRSLGLPARYVSGYLLTDPPPGQPKLIGVDASHAWLAVFVPSYGWLDFDPTNNQIPGQRHLTLGWGRDYGDVCPIKGTFLGGGTHRMQVAVDVRPLEEANPQTNGGPRG